MVLTGCGDPTREQVDGDGPLRVAATTTIVGDMVERIGGDAIALRVLLPRGADPHGYIFRPVDMAAVADADLLFINGGGLEGHLERLLQAAGNTTETVSLAHGIDHRLFTDQCDSCHSHHHDHEDAPGHTHQHDRGAIDPHFWFDPHNMMIWCDTIAVALGQWMPAHAAVFQERAAAVQAELRELDEWITEQVARIPPTRRVLVTDHQTFGYFARRYGFEEVGVILPSFDSMAQASARHLGRLTKQLREQAVPAIFIGMNVNPTLAERVSEDTGIPVIRVHLESLTGPDGTAPDYFAMMRYNVQQMVDHLGAQ